LLDCDAGLEPAPGASELGVESLERGDTGVDAGGPGVGVAAGLGGGVHPHDPVTLHRGQWRGSGRVDLVGVTLPRAGAAGGFGPDRGVGLQVLAERAVLSAGPGHDGDEPATTAVEVAHRGPGAQLGVRHVEEVGPAQQPDQAVPGRHVGRVIDGVAVREPVGQRDRTVGADRQDPDQLLEVRSVILGVPERDHRGRLTAPAGADRVAVDAMHRDRRGVVVELAGVDGELADRAEHHRGQQAGPVGVEQRLQGPPDPVIVEPADLLGGQPEQRRVVTGGPLAQAVERLTAQHQVRHDQPDRGRRAHLHPGIAVRQRRCQQSGEPEPVGHRVDDRQPTQDP